MGSRIYCIKAFSFFIVYHFTVACLLSRNCLLSQQLPHISVSNVLLIFVVFSFFLFFFFAFCHGQGTEFVSLESIIPQHLPYRYFIAFPKQMCYHGFTSDMQIYNTHKTHRSH